MPSRDSPNYDRIYKIRPFLDKLLTSFKTNYKPSQYLSIDESMISFKGRLSWIQYMPKKPTKWGMKAWVLADSTNGYVYNWKLYTGKETNNTVKKGLAHRVVLELLQDLVGNTYEVYVDNFYTSPALFTDLIHLGFKACGTLNNNRRGINQSFKNHKLAKGELYSERTDDDKMMCLKWKDKREVCMLSTFHDDSVTSKKRRTKHSADGTETIKKPKVVEDYNQYMGGVDKSDQLILYYGFAHRRVKWWERAFFHLLDLCLVNAHILYNMNNSKKLTQLDFRIEVGKSLLDGFQSHISHHFVSTELPLRLTERPFPEPVPTDTPYGGRPQCEVCRSRKQKRSQTQYRCKQCKTPLHLHPCFEIYHTKLHYHIC